MKFLIVFSCASDTGYCQKEDIGVTRQFVLNYHKTHYSFKTEMVEYFLQNNKFVNTETENS